MGKRALLVGINEYSRPKHNLRGCENDIREWLLLLTNPDFGFKRSDVQILLNAEATRDYIMGALKKLVERPQKGDVLVFIFAGHGSQVPAINPDNELDDKKDEVLVPHNVGYDNLITDNKINEIVTSSIPSKGVNFTAIFDCCHSSTLMREISLEAEGDPTLNRWISPDVLLPNFPHEVLWRPMSIREISLGPYFSFSACQDSETAADTWLMGSWRGVFSFALQELISEKPALTYKELESSQADLVQRVKRYSPRHKQNPQIYIREAFGDVPLFHPI